MQFIWALLTLIGGLAGIITIVQVVAPLRHRLRTVLRQWLFADEQAQLLTQAEYLNSVAARTSLNMDYIVQHAQQIAALETTVERLVTKADLHDMRLNSLGGLVDSITPGYIKIGSE